MAIPLSEVARLEEFKRSEVEQSGEQDVVQYRGEIMPLVYLKKVLRGDSSQEAADTDLMQSIVFTKDGRSVGLVVERIVDIVEESVEVKRGANRPGVLGTIVVQDRVTDLLDIESVVASADPSFLVDTQSVALLEEA